ncbi:DMT family transporter [Ideonella livida]|uniref:DMT family transporter n=1 Tax=Ideonella livida TaxID=2707176 RepID=A0A7C9PHW3_9BURK|nr:DMT family transporter [Ideonella livida]NDY92397.1 DMT family transporter [Ideonella livida]
MRTHSPDYAPSPTPPAGPTPAQARLGLWLGALGVLIFAMTFPMTRLAVGPMTDPQLPPAFVTAGRAAGAGVLSLGWLLWLRAPWPQRHQWTTLAVSALGTVVGFPLGLALALREVPAMHAAVVTGILPLATAALAAWVLRQRASLGFWACAVAGCLLVLVFAWRAGGGHWVAADGWLLLAVAGAAVGYVAGARLSAQMPAQQVICWVLVLSLPLTVPVTWAVWPTRSASAAAWGGMAYVTVFSMWLGFFAWYRGLALGGTLRVSQVQLIQPFLALLLAVPVLGEPLRGETLFFSVAVMAVVLVGKRMPTSTAHPSPTSPVTPTPSER